MVMTASDVRARMQKIDALLENMHLLTGSQIMALNVERKDLLKRFYGC